MITGELKSKIDAVWNDFWSGGIANPLEVMEQLTYLLFIKGLDERQTLAERHGTYRVRSPDSRWSAGAPGRTAPNERSLASCTAVV